MGWVRIGPGWVGPMDNSEVEATRNKQAYAQRDSPGGDTAARGGSAESDVADCTRCLLQTPSATRRWLSSATTP